MTTHQLEFERARVFFLERTVEGAEKTVMPTNPCSSTVSVCVHAGSRESELTTSQTTHCPTPRIRFYKSIFHKPYRTEKPSRTLGSAFRARKSVPDEASAPGIVRLPVFALLTLLSFALCAGPAAAAPLIGGWSKTAGPGETVFLTGAGLASGRVLVNDGAQTLEARVLMRDARNVTAVIPEGLSDGTLWLSIEGGPVTITLNNPTPWWCYSDRPDFGDTIRIFGRNFESTSPTATVLFQHSSTGRVYRFSGVVTEPNVITVQLNRNDAGGQTLSYGEYHVWLDEPKTAGANLDYEGCKATIMPRFKRSNVTRNVRSYGAVPDDGRPDNAAFNAALEAVFQAGQADSSSSGGGRLLIPAGVYNFDETLGYPVLGAGLWVRDGVVLEGAGVDETSLEFEPGPMSSPSYSMISLCEHSELTGVTVKAIGNNFPRMSMVGGGDWSRIAHVKLDADESNQRLYLCGVSDYGVIEDAELYGARAVYIEGRQSRLTNVRHYGPLAMEHYTAEDINPMSFMGAAYSSRGNCEFIMEDCLAESRWESERGFIQRLLSCGTVNGGVHHMYMARNRVVNPLVVPFAGTGECVLFETYSSRYHGQVTVGGVDGRILSTQTPMPISNVYQYQQKSPLHAFITSGPGMGQYRKCLLTSEYTVELEEPFLIPPDPVQSTVLIQFTQAENIIYANDLNTNSPYGGSSVGIQFYSKTVDNIVSYNKISGFRIGYMDWISETRRPCVNYYNEISYNRISDTGLGMVTLAIGPNYPSYHLGNTYRDNRIENMDLDLHQWAFMPPHAGISIYNYVGTVNDGVKPIFGQIYEGNVVKNAHAGLSINWLADWVTIRNNRFVDLYHEPMTVDQTVRVIGENNELNRLPTISISPATPVPYRTVFKPPYGERISSDRDLYVWDGPSGMAELSISDPDGDPTSILNVGGARIIGKRVYWENLSPGVHNITVSVSDGKGIATKKIILIVGQTETFDNAIVARDGSTSTYTIMTSLGRHVTRLVNILAPDHSQEVLISNTHNGGGKCLMIRPSNEEVAIVGNSSAEMRSNAMLSVVKNHHTYKTSHLKLRLIHDEDSYYEFFDYVGYTPDWKIRRITKIVDGVKQLEALKVAGHETESAVTFIKEGTRLRGLGWGDEIELIDPDPLQIHSWEILTQNTPNNDFQKTFCYVTFDNLVFEKWGMGAPQLDSLPEFRRGTSNTVSWTAPIVPSRPDMEFNHWLEWSTDSQFRIIAGSSGWTSDTTYVVADLMHGATYYYRLKSRDEDLVESMWSNVVSCTQDAYAPITQATALPATVASATFPVNWSAVDAVSGVAEVRIYYRRGTAGAFQLYNTVASGSSTTFDTTQTGGDGDYYLYTVGVDNVGNVEADPSMPDVQTTVMTDPGGLTAPLIAAEPAYTRGLSNTVSWLVPGGTQESVLECSTDPGFDPGDIVSSSGWVSLQSFTVSSLTDGERYYYRVKSRDAGQTETSWSNMVESVQDDLAPQTSVQGVASFSFTDKFPVTLSGSDSGSGLAHIRLMYRKDESGPFAPYGSFYGPGSVFFDCNLTGGDGIYEFFSIGTDLVGNEEAAPTQYVRTVVQTAQPPEPDLAEEPLFTPGLTNQLSWTSLGVAPSYYLEWSTNATFSPVAGGSGWISSTSYVAQGLHHGRTYFYRVKCRTASFLESNWSNVVTSTQDAMPPQTNVLVLPPIHMMPVFYIPWEGMDDASGLENVRLYYRKGTTGQFVLYQGTFTSTIQFDSQLAGGDGEYYFYTVGTDHLGNEEAAPLLPDAWTTVKTTPPTDPVLAAEPQYTPGTTNTLTWLPPAGATESFLQWSTNLGWTVISGNSGWISGTEHTATGLTNLQFYYYRVKSRGPSLPETAWSNWVKSTQDASPPNSEVLGLPPTIMEPTFDIQCLSGDSPSGVRAVRLFYRHDETGGFVEWPVAFTSGTLAFASEFAAGSGRYEFYSVAEDYAGNVEAPPAEPDAETIVGGWDPHIAWSPETIELTVTEGQACEANFTIRNTGGGSFLYSMIVASGFPTSLDSDSGNAVSGGTPISHVLTCNTAGLLPGDYAASIFVYASAAENNPAAIPVRVTVEPLRALYLNADPPGAGIVLPGILTTHEDRTWASVDAVPVTGWLFSNWTGDISGPEPAQDVYMNSSKVATAHFTRVPGPDLGGNCASVFPYMIIHGSPVLFDARIWNDGTAHANPFWVEFWAVGESGRYQLSDSLLISGGLDSGAVISLEDYPPPVCLNTVPGGLYHLEMVIDPNNAIGESNEYDNVVSLGTVRIVADLADLQIEHFGFSPQDVDPDGGTPISFTGRIVNRGSKATDRSFWVEFRVWPSVRFEPTGPYLCAEHAVTNLIGPGESVDLASIAAATNELAPGAYWVGVIVNSSGAVAEQRADNNMTWSLKKLYVGPRPAGVKRWVNYK